ncbi:MAG: bifunctional phosphoglucose/phosphomannose isomerase [Planctomycetota bacterium]
MNIIDDVERMRALDPENMYNRIFDLPEQLLEALKIATSWNVPVDNFADIKNILVIGMGGSAIGGDMVRSLLGSQLLIPFQVCRHYQLPEYVDDETLVIVSSYSGNTEEMLSALDDALHRKAMLAAITTGGMLEDLAGLNAIPVAMIPAGLQPRAAIGYSFVPLLVFMEKVGLVQGMSDQIEQAAARLITLRENYIESESWEKNPAKRLATQIHGRMPIIYSGPTLTDVIAVRWKGQICENAKNMAFANHYAEFNHNELVGWSDIIAAHRDHLAVIQLFDADDHPKILRRMEIVGKLIEKQGVPVMEVRSIGQTALERMLSLVQFGDFVSYYLAILNEVDPTPVAVIETLKKALSNSA